MGVSFRASPGLKEAVYCLGNVLRRWNQTKQPELGKKARICVIKRSGLDLFWAAACQQLLVAWSLAWCSRPRCRPKLPQVVPATVPEVRLTFSLGACPSRTLPCTSETRFSIKCGARWDPKRAKLPT